MLWPTVSRPIRLGVGTPLSPMTRFFYFLSLLDSCFALRLWAPFLRASRIEVTLRLTVSQSVSQSECLGIEYPCGTCDQILLPVGMLLSEICCLLSVGRPLWREDGSKVEVSLQLTVRLYVLVSSTLVGLATRYYFLSECCYLKSAVLFLWVASLTRGRLCNLRCNHSIVRVTQNPKSYFTVSSVTTSPPQTWRAWFPYLYSPGKGLSSYTPGHWVPFTSSLTTRRATVEVS
jgi:hypothetical protein